MTSSNVSNMLMQAVDLPKVDVVTNKSPMFSNNDSFEKALLGLSDVAAQQTNDGNYQSSKSIQIDSSKEVKVSVSENTNSVDDEKIETVVEEVDKFENKIKDVLKEELDVTEEQLEEAMEVLGLTFIDLMNPQNLVQLVVELKDEVDSIGLLIDDGFKNILDQVADIAKQLLDQTESSIDEINQIMNSINNQKEIDISINIDSNVSIKEGLEETVDVKAANEEIGVPVQEEKTQAIERDNDNESVSSELGMNAIDSKIDSNNSSETNGNLNQYEDHQSSSKMEKKMDDSMVFSNSGNITFETKFNPQIETVELPTGESVDVKEMIDQIVEQAKVFTSPETTTMEMTLNPEGLGKIYMEVSQKGDEVTAKLFAENEVVKTALENQMASLRTQMNESGVKVTSIEVAVGTHEFERNLEEGQKDNQNPNDESKHQSNRRRSLDLTNLDELSGLMSEEEELVYKIMRENGNTLDYQA